VPEFTNPFSGSVPERKLTKEELIRAIRLDIAAEHEATSIYMAHAEAIDDPLAKAVLIDIANEEREHIGEFQRLLQILSGDEDQWIANGVAEVDEIAAGVAAGTWPQAMETGDAGAGPQQHASVRESVEAGGDETTPASPPPLGSLRP